MVLHYHASAVCEYYLPWAWWNYAPNEVLPVYDRSAIDLVRSIDVVRGPSIDSRVNYGYPTTNEFIIPQSDVPGEVESETGPIM